MSGNKHNNSPSPAKDAALETLKATRDFGIYLDMLNGLKREYLIIFCLKNTSGQNFSEAVVEKIRRIGFSGFTSEPDMKYAGVISEGVVTSDISMPADEPPASFEGTVSDTKLYVSFLCGEAEIKIDGKDVSLRDKGLNIAVYDLKRAEAADVSCYNAAENNPTFYHRNFYYDEQYIESHIYVPDSCKETVTLPLRRSYFSNRSLNVREVERGIFLPTRGIYEVDRTLGTRESYKAYGGICDENFNFIAGHQLFNPRSMDIDGRHILDSYRVEPENVAYADETVLYGGTLIEHPGHLIIECFADRLWWIAQNTDSDIKIAIEIIWGSSKMESTDNSFVTGMLKAFGIPSERVIIIAGPVMFKKIIIPDQSAIPLNYCFPYEFTKEFILPFQHIAKRLAPGKYKKIYLSRSKVHGSNVLGEEFFIDFFEKKGFRIIAPEDYTMQEKAELMYGADEVVTLDGTNALFSVFCRPTARLTVLTRRMDFWDTPLQLVVEALGIKEFFLVNVSGNFLENFSGSPFINYGRGLTLTYASREFQEYVKYIYNEELDITPEQSLQKHIYEYLARFPEYYSTPFSFLAISSIKMTDILRSMSEVFSGRELDLRIDDAVLMTDDEVTISKLELQLQHEKNSSAEKIKLLSEKAKVFIEENASLKQALTQLEAENRQLRSEKAEMASYMAEVSSLLDALEAQSGAPSDE